MRLNKFIASISQFSRRKADELIKNGQISINGNLVTEMGTQVDPEKDLVKIDGKIINQLGIKQKKIYLLLNKPTGYVCTRHDEFNRKTILELIPFAEKNNLKPVGRLDYHTEGLIILSNDGDFIYRATHPKFELEKEYFVRIGGNLAQEEKQKIENGIFLEGKKLSPSKIVITDKKTGETSLKMTIHEGRNRQIRKTFASFGYNVKYLQRIRIGSLVLANLKIGASRELTKQEIDAF